LLNIFFNSLLSSFILISSGIFLKNKKKLEIHDICEKAFFGAIFLSFISLILNFILPINKTVSNIVLIFLIILFLLNYKNYHNLKNIFITIVCASCLTTLIITLDNIYRPDAGLYHLPYTKIINESNIIIGLANIHFRFGHISIIQYLNAIFNNQILGNHGVLLPTASIFSFFLIYLMQEIKNNFNNKILSVFLFFIFSYTLYGYNRYGEFGNDATAHIYLILVFIFFLKYFNKENIQINLINKLFLLSIFSFLQKTTMLIGIFIPFYCFVLLKNKIRIINFSNFFSFIFLFFWLIKNILISGCIIYPISITCFDKLNWFTNDKNYQISATYQSLENESWSKGWPDKKGAQLSFEQYNKNFNWVTTWIPNHGMQILNKLSLYILFILIFLYLIKKNKKKENNSNGNILVLLFPAIIGTFLWFIRFPTYRYGSSYIVLTIILISIYYFQKKYDFIDSIKFKKKIFLFIIIFFSLFTCKHTIRIIKNFNLKYYDYPWPRIYGDNFENSKEKSKPVLNNKKIIYYKSKTICMYSDSPCTHFDINNIKYKEKFIFKIINIK
jgi:hypothetical protein